MDENGFAFKSGQLQFNDRILACNGVDFMKEHTTQQVKDIFYEMAQEPLLRMAISRGVSLLDAEADDSRDEEGHMTTQEGPPRSQLSPPSYHPSHQPETINKTVLTFDISLYNSNAAWLGITVYPKKAGDMGIYIKSITPGGAAAMVGTGTVYREREYWVKVVT